MINFNNPKNKNLLLFGKLDEHIKMQLKHICTKIIYT